MVRRILEIALEGISHNALYLAVGILLAACMQALVDRARLMALMRRSGWAGIVLATAAGSLTPLCSCATTAVILSLVASGVPWAPVVSFLVSSPLMSPSVYVLTAGVFGVPMANAKLITALALGLASGGIAAHLEARGMLVNGARFAPRREASACSCLTSAAPPRTAVSRLLSALRDQGYFILKYFVIYSLVGAAAQVLVPQSWIKGLFGAGKSYSIVTATILGIPLYMSGAASIPFAGSLVSMGMGRGAALAFLTAGPGTHLGALAAVALVSPKIVWWLYLATVLLGSIIAGLAYNAAHPW
ncbi:MAG: permease [Firmicutes bacterium]|jgi:uncharacterized membrane protein YraQ (UPF0718 family)|nr:permease [Bacillota bacterium]